LDRYNKNKISFLLSGQGSNLLNILKKDRFHKKLNIISIISNNTISKEIKKFLIKNDMRTRIYENKSKLEKYFFKDANVIFSVGYMQIIPRKFITKFKIINLHPSFLPAYKGLMTHKRALINKEKFGGFSIHLVTKFLDEGKILSQTQYRIRTKKEKDLISSHKNLENNLVYSELIKVLN
jgi:phosphoribosylglycinamide formyltransferase-1